MTTLTLHEYDDHTGHTSKYRKPLDSAQARPSCSVTTLRPRSVLFAATTTMQFFAPYLRPIFELVEIIGGLGTIRQKACDAVGQVS